MNPDFEESGWARFDNSNRGSDKIALKLEDCGVNVEQLDIKLHIAGFKAFLQLPQYAGEYRNYGGSMDHCLLEKVLEHYLSLVVAAPQAGQTSIDIGSCRSVVPDILRHVYGVRCYEQDLEYPPGIDRDRIGSSAAQIPLPDSSVDFMTLHCTFEHFEGEADTVFVHECARLLKPGGRTVILPLYLNSSFCNVTGESTTSGRSKVVFDSDADFHCVVPEWRNRFGRHYSPRALISRVVEPAISKRLVPHILRIRNWEEIHPQIWLRWALILEKPQAC